MIIKKILKWGRDNPTKISLDDKKLYKELHNALSYKQNIMCPFCKQMKCSHWDGMGWVNPSITKGQGNDL